MNKGQTGPSMQLSTRICHTQIMTPRLRRSRAEKATDAPEEMTPWRERRRGPEGDEVLPFDP